MRRLRLYSIEIILVVALVGAVSYFGYLGYGLISPATAANGFSGERAFENVEIQLAHGAGARQSEQSQCNNDIWVVENLCDLGWRVIIQQFGVVDDIPQRNLIAIRSGAEDAPVAIIGTHYDGRILHDQDPDVVNPDRPGPGANGDGSGVAILLELARTLDTVQTGHTVCLALFDATFINDQSTWQGETGSIYFWENVNQEEEVAPCNSPRFILLLDSVGATNHQILAYPQEQRPNDLAASLKKIPSILGYPAWNSTQSLPLISGNQIPFLVDNIPTLYISDPSYSARFTSEDQIDKLSITSLEQIGRTLETWLENGAEFTE